MGVMVYRVMEDGRAPCSGGGTGGGVGGAGGERWGRGGGDGLVRGGGGPRAYRRSVFRYPFMRTDGLLARHKWYFSSIL